MFEDDRPIKPQPKYLEEAENKYKQQLKKNAHMYLQKGNPHLLPCYKQQISDEQKQHRFHEQQPLSKAQQYQLIKKQNRQKFGEWQKHPVEINGRKKEKKIKPSQMTVNWKPKVVNIDTREYKNPNYVEDPKRAVKKEQINQKKEYQRMIEYMRKLYGVLEKEKQEYEKEREYLKFKKVIQQEPGLEIRSKICTGLNQFKSIMVESKPINNQNNDKLANSQPSPEDGMDQPNEDQNIHQFHYPIDKLHECNPFSIRQIYKYVHLNQLVPENTQFYTKAKRVIEQERQKAKVKTIKPNCTHRSIGANHVVCLQQECAEKRISKFTAGWFELWVAGRFRTVYNENTGYKVVWYNNGDIKQQFTHKKVEFYHSKAKKVVQVKVGQNLPFWYYPFIGQLQTKNAKGDTEIIFADGRHQIVLASEHS